MVRARPVSCGCVLDSELVFLPNEIPRRGVFAAWGNGPGNPVPGTARVELVFPGGTYGIRKRMVSAELIPLAEALPLLMSTSGNLRMRRSVRVWAAAAAAGVGLVARGRLLPTVGPGDLDVWRAGPLDPSDLGWRCQRRWPKTRSWPTTCRAKNRLRRGSGWCCSCAAAATPA